MSEQVRSILWDFSRVLWVVACLIIFSAVFVSALLAVFWLVNTLLPSVIGYQSLVVVGVFVGFTKLPYK